MSMFPVQSSYSLLSTPYDEPLPPPTVTKYEQDEKEAERIDPMSEEAEDSFERIQKDLSTYDANLTIHKLFKLAIDRLNALDATNIEISWDIPREDKGKLQHTAGLLYKIENRNEYIFDTTFTLTALSRDGQNIFKMVQKRPLKEDFYPTRGVVKCFSDVKRMAFLHTLIPLLKPGLNPGMKVPVTQQEIDQLMLKHSFTDRERINYVGYFPKDPSLPEGGCCVIS